MAQWFREALPPRWSGRPLDSTARERQLARWSAAEYMAARKKGEVSCEARAMVGLGFIHLGDQRVCIYKVGGTDGNFLLGWT